MSEHNYLTEPGAKLLAKRIERYWREQGYAGIKTHIIEHVLDELLCERYEHRRIYFVRSNIGPLGFPPRTIEEAAAA